MNINKPSKKITLYAYFNINNPMVAWEVAIGRVKSDFKPNLNEFGISLWQYSMLRKYARDGIDQKFINELLLEDVRQRLYPQQVSRLKGMYFFETEEDAINALSRWGMPYLREYISAVDFLATELTKVDSEWITNNLCSTNDITWMNKYWEGKTCGIRPLTEILARGTGVIVNYNLRVEAYKKIYNQFPQSTPLLAMALCGFQAKHIDDIALLKTALVTDEDKVVGNYYIKIDDLDIKQKEIEESIVICKKNNTFPPIVIPSDQDVFFRLPDLSMYKFELESSQANNILSKIRY